MVVQLSWLSGRALAAQARGVLGLTPVSCRPFHFSSITSKFIYFQCEARCSEHICTLFNYPIQVIWKRLYKTASSKEIGTLHQLRNAINQRSVTTKPKKDFSMPMRTFHSSCCGICTWGSHENVRNGELEDDSCQQTLPPDVRLHNTCEEGHLIVSDWCHCEQVR